MVTMVTVLAATAGGEADIEPVGRRAQWRNSGVKPLKRGDGHSLRDTPGYSALGHPQNGWIVVQGCPKQQVNQQASGSNRTPLPVALRETGSPRASPAIASIMPVKSRSA